MAHLDLPPGKSIFSLIGTWQHGLAFVASKETTRFVHRDEIKVVIFDYNVHIRATESEAQ